MPVRKITRRQVEVRGSGVPGCLGLYTLSQTNKQTRVGAISSLVGRGHCAAGNPLPWDGKGLASFPCLSGNWGSVWNWRASCAVSERVSLSDMLGDGNLVQGVTACNLNSSGASQNTEVPGPVEARRRPAAGLLMSSVQPQGPSQSL